MGVCNQLNQLEYFDLLARMTQISQLDWRGTGAVQIAHTGFPGHLNDIAIFAIFSPSDIRLA